MIKAEVENASTEKPLHLKAHVCIVCGSEETQVFFEILKMPVHSNLLWRNQADALKAPRGDILLTYCHHCGHVYNSLFAANPPKYNQQYENSLDFSPRFQVYIQELAIRLVERYGLYGKDILEIGCGQGEFLSLLCKLGNNRGIGFDPSYIELPGQANDSQSIQFVQDYYSEKYSRYRGDLICSRHVLEHLQNPGQFLSDIRKSIRKEDQPILFFEVPNALFTLRELSVWDIIYEHCSYFHSLSLTYLLLSCGYKVLNLTEAYEGQFLCLEAEPENLQLEYEQVQSPTNRLDEIEIMVRDFASNYQKKVEFWMQYLTQIKEGHKRVVIWGAGSKGVSFLNFFNIKNEILYAVDINPHKQGMYITGTGQRIVPPEYLQDYRPEVVIVMNKIYMTEIHQVLFRIGLQPDLLCA